MTLSDLQGGAKPISKMNKEELDLIIKGLDIKVPENATNPMKMDAIRESGKWVAGDTAETGGGVSFGKNKNGDKVRMHKTLGEYKKCIIHPTEASQQNTSVFASIGLYTVEFQPRTEVQLPEKMINFLKESTAVQHVYDASAQNSRGGLGAHVAKQVPKYIVEVL